MKNYSTSEIYDENIFLEVLLKTGTVFASGIQFFSEISFENLLYEV